MRPPCSPDMKRDPSILPHFNAVDSKTGVSTAATTSASTTAESEWRSERRLGGNAKGVDIPTSAASVSPTAGVLSLFHPRAVNHLHFPPRVRPEIVAFVAGYHGHATLVQTTQIPQTRPQRVKALGKEGLRSEGESGMGKVGWTGEENGSRLKIRYGIG